MCKVRSTGLDISACKWIENCLKDRIQRVVVNDSYSEWSKVISGVPQGSVLGPLLFNIFINDIGSEIKSNISVFADDTKLCRGITSLQDVADLQANLNALSNWATKWQMIGLMFNGLMLINVKLCTWGLRICMHHTC